MAMYLSATFCSGSAFAISQDQKDIFDKGIGFYNTEACGGNSATTLVGNDNLQKIFNYFVDKGYTPEQAAGIDGNVNHESHGGDPEISQYDEKDHEAPPHPDDPLEGWGIVQWSPAHKILQYAGTVNEPAYTLDTQVEFLAKQLDGTAPNSSEKPAGDKLRQVTTGIVEDLHDGKGPTLQTVAWHAAQVFLISYERAADHAPDGLNAKIRGDDANKYLALYGASSQVGADSASATTSASCSTAGTPVHCDSPTPTGGYDAIKSALLSDFKIDLRGDANTEWAAETFATMCTLAKAPAFYSKLVAQGPVTVSLHTSDHCGGGHTGNNSGDGYDDPYGLAMIGFCDKDYNRFLLTHELGHMYFLRNPGVYQAFDNQVWGKAPTLPTYNCQHDYDIVRDKNGNIIGRNKGPYEAECWADMIGEYLVWFDIRDNIGGSPPGPKDFKQYPTEYAAYYNFARDQLFGGVTFTSF